MGLATSTYLVDNDDRMPRGAEGSDYKAVYGASSMGVPFIHLADYLNLESVYPTFTTARRDAYYRSSDIFRCPSRVNDPKALLDYSVNALHFEKFYTTGSNVEAGWFSGATADTLEMDWPTDYLKDMSKTMLYAENNRANFNYSGSSQFFSSTHLPWRNGAINTSTSSLRMMGSEDQTHKGNMAYTAFDGSAHTISLNVADEWPSNNARMTGEY